MDQYGSDDGDDSAGGPKRRKDFDCPDCNANNPADDGFAPGDEVRCNYCGMEYKVELSSEGRWRFREI
jgi:transcription elongation factor Elf1